MSQSLGSLVKETFVETVEEGLATLSGENLPGQLGRPLQLPQFVTGLATAPVALPRQLFGMLAQLLVPPGCSAVVHLPGGITQVYSSGSYWLWGMPGAVVVQWVDKRRQQLPVGPVEGWSRDKWRVRLWLLLEVAVAEPAIVAAHREPLLALAAAARAEALRFIEQHSHAELTGCEGGGGLDAPAVAIPEGLRNDPALAGLELISVRVIERQGDERQIEAAMAATVAAAQIDEGLRVEAARHRARLHELECQVSVGEREHSLRIAAVTAQARERLITQQAEVQQAALAARLDLVMAQIRAQVAEIAHDEQLWQAEQARIQSEWERLQGELARAHQTDQQIRLLDSEQGLARDLATTQLRLAEQRDRQAHAIAERREAHEQALLELHLRHEALVAEQMQKLTLFRAEAE